MNSLLVTISAIVLAVSLAIYALCWMHRRSPR